MRGPKPQPTALKLLRGLPGRRPVNLDEPCPELAGFEPPDWLSPEARAEWEARAPKLIELGLLTEIDIDTFGAYCQTRVDYQHAVAMLRQTGEVIRVNVTKYDKKTQKPLDGTVAASPYVRIRERSLARMQALAAEFGLSPSARSRVRVKSAKQKSKAEKFKSAAPKLRAVK